MNLYTDYQQFQGFHGTSPSKTAVTIGNFDGCHRGHQHLLSKVKHLAANHQTSALVLSFFPRPEDYFKQTPNTPLLMSTALKQRSMAEAGIQHLVIQPFDKTFGELSAEDFFHQILLEALQATSVVVGDNFQFGRGRTGNIELLKRLTAHHHIHFETGGTILFNQRPISSTRIRACIAEGNVQEATEMLGRPYLLEGMVAQGDQLGRQIGTPTANLVGLEQLLPKTGVYAGYAWVSRKESQASRPTILSIDKHALPAVMNIGYRPTLRNPQPTLQVEVHVLDQQWELDSLYGQPIGFYVCHRLRDERRFPDLDALKQQIAQDIAQTKNILGDRQKL